MGLSFPIYKIRELVLKICLSSSQLEPGFSSLPFSLPLHSPQSFLLSSLLSVTESLAKRLWERQLVFRALTLARETITAMPGLTSLRVFLSVVGTVRGRGNFGFCGARAIQGQCPSGPVLSDQEAFFWLPFDSRILSVLSLLPPSLTVPFCQFLPHQTLQTFSSFLMFVLVIHAHSDPYFTAIISLPGTFHCLRTFTPYHMSFPFTLPSPACSPLSHLL